MRTLVRIGGGRIPAGFSRGVRALLLPLLMVWLPPALHPACHAAEEAPAVPAGLRPETVAEVIPPPAADAENAAPLYLEALAALEAEDVWGRNVAELAAELYAELYSPGADGNLVALLDGFRVTDEGNRHPTVSDACEELARRLEGPGVKRALALVDKAAGLPRCRFDVDYSKGAETPLPHLAKLRTLSRVLATVAAATAEQGDRATAWECTSWGLHVADGVRDEPLLISQLVRIAQASIAISVLQQVSGSVPPDAAVSRRLDGVLARFDDSGPLVRALDGERLIFGEWLFGQPAEKVRELLTAEGTAEAPPLTLEQIAAERQAYREAMVRLTDTASLPYHEAKPRLEALLAAAKGPDAAPLTRGLVPALGPCFRKAAEFQALVRVTRIGLRLRQHQAGHGIYPRGLAELALDGIPPDRQPDPFTGKPLEYRLEGPGFVLYSLGPDGLDNSGTMRRGGGPEGCDIVWRTTR